MGGKSKAPDYKPMADASEEAARYGYRAATDQLDFAKQQYAEYKPIIDQIAQSQLGLMGEQMRQGQDYYDYMQQQYRPLENQMVQRVKDYNSDAHREQLAQQAAADAGLAFQNTQASNERAMASMGVNPNSGRFAGQQRASELGLAAQRANAMSQTRTQAEGLGYARLADVVGMGRGLPGASQGAYQVATGAGTSAAQNVADPGTNYMAGLGQGASTIGSGQSMYLSGLGTALNGQASVYNNQSDPLATIAGLGLGFLSSKKAKTKEGGVDAEAVSRAMEQLPVDRWRYKPGQGDGGQAPHIGPYAEDMTALGAGTPDGRAIDVISALGLNTAAAKGLGRRVSKLERQAGRQQHG